MTEETTHHLYNELMASFSMLVTEDDDMRAQNLSGYAELTSRDIVMFLQPQDFAAAISCAVRLDGENILILEEYQYLVSIFEEIFGNEKFHEYCCDVQDLLKNLQDSEYRHYLPSSNEKFVEVSCS